MQSITSSEFSVALPPSFPLLLLAFVVLLVDFGGSQKKGKRNERYKCRTSQTYLDAVIHKTVLKIGTMQVKNRHFPINKTAILYHIAQTHANRNPFPSIGQICAKQTTLEAVPQNDLFFSFQNDHPILLSPSLYPTLQKCLFDCSFKLNC